MDKQREMNRRRESVYVNASTRISALELSVSAASGVITTSHSADGTLSTELVIDVIFAVTSVLALSIAGAASVGSALVRTTANNGFDDAGAGSVAVGVHAQVSRVTNRVIGVSRVAFRGADNRGVISQGASASTSGGIAGVIEAAFRIGLAEMRGRGGKGGRKRVTGQMISGLGVSSQESVSSLQTTSLHKLFVVQGSLGTLRQQLLP